MTFRNEEIIKQNDERLKRKRSTHYISFLTYIGNN